MINSQNNVETKKILAKSTDYDDYSLLAKANVELFLFSFNFLGGESQKMNKIKSDHCLHNSNTSITFIDILYNNH